MSEQQTAGCARQKVGGCHEAISEIVPGFSFAVAGGAGVCRWARMRSDFFDWNMLEK